MHWAQTCLLLRMRSSPSLSPGSWLPSPPPLPPLPSDPPEPPGGPPLAALALVWLPARPCEGNGSPSLLLNNCIIRCVCGSAAELLKGQGALWLALGSIRPCALMAVTGCRDERITCAHQKHAVHQQGQCDTGLELAAFIHAPTCLLARIPLVRPAAPRCSIECILRGC